MTTPLSEEARSLVEAYLPMVGQVLAGVAAHYPRHTDREELAQAANLGLVEAAARFDPARGVPFERWAALRVRGAILDAVRALDFAPRALRAAARDVQAARDALELSLGRRPTPDELAGTLGLPTVELSRLEGRVHRSLVLSLDAPCGEKDGHPLTLASGLVDELQLEPVELLELRERACFVRDALACLPDRLREVVVGYFLEGRTSAELAARLGVTESRVSQLRTEGLGVLRRAIGARYGESEATGRLAALPRMRQAADDLVEVAVAG